MRSRRSTSKRDPAYLASLAREDLPDRDRPVVRAVDDHGDLVGLAVLLACPVSPPRGLAVDLDARALRLTIQQMGSKHGHIEAASASILEVSRVGDLDDQGRHRRRSASGRRRPNRESLGRP